MTVFFLNLLAIFLTGIQKKDDIKSVCVRGGITNSLFACYLESNGMNHNDTILFRVYGENSEKFISRSNEIETMCLMNKVGLGPKFYARFRNGICYEYLPGSILDQKMVVNQNIFTKVAKAIAGLRKYPHNPHYYLYCLKCDIKRRLI